MNFLGLHHLLAGELATAERLIDEASELISRHRRAPALPLATRTAAPVHWPLALSPW